MDKKKYRVGITGIERKIKDKHEETSKAIDSAFRDLNSLMSYLGEMVKISSGIKEELKGKNDKISSDETVMFKSYLLNLGVNLEGDDPVKRSKFSSSNKYFRDLAKQVSKLTKPIASEKGGQLSLTEVFCILNRARGFDLISPDDLLDACGTLSEQPELGLSLVQYPSGLIVLQCDDFDQNFVNSQISSLLETLEFMTAQELALQIGISVALARQRLLDAEKFGVVCRDESIQGLRFYPNKFMEYNGGDE